MNNFPERPLLTDSTLSKLEEILKPSFRVVEQGSGGSTIWLAERVDFLISFERSQEWVSVTNEQLEILGLHKKAKSIHVEGRVLEPIELVGLDLVDLVLVDGQISDRTPFALAMMEHIRPGGWLVIDNTLSTDVLEYKLWQILEALRPWSYEHTFGYIDTRPNACTFWQKPSVK